MSRTALSFSRDLEFVSRTELTKRMGCHPGLWLRATLKELIDNALDACEEAGVAPEITVSTGDHEISVTDDGPGMPPALVDRLCDRSRRTSAREAYAAPDRGSQGNALQTLMCLHFGFGLDAAGIMITSRGVRHVIDLRVNRLAQSVELEHAVTDCPAEPGTCVRLAWPEPVDGDEVAWLVHEHAWLNPHAGFHLTVDGDTTTWEATAPIKKWTPGQPIPPHWYTPERFAHRVLLEIGSNPGITAQQFLGTFRGLTDRSRRAEIAAACGLTGQPLRALLDASGRALDDARARALLHAMQQEGRAPRPDALGRIGKETVFHWISNQDCPEGTEPQFLAYATVDLLCEDVPIVWEIGFAAMPDDGRGRQLLVGHNFSPVIDPEHVARLILSDTYFGSELPVAVFLHRITPSRHTLDFGKTVLMLHQDETRLVADALASRTKGWRKHRLRQLRGRAPRLPVGAKPDVTTVKDAVWLHLPAAYAEASSDGAFPTSPRQIYYRLRPRILAATGKESFGYGYFSTDLLPRYEQERPEAADWRIFRKARGQLIEPHTDRAVPLGTAEVADYRERWTNGLDHLGIAFAMPEWGAGTVGPRNRYGGLVVVEKDGIADLLIIAGVGARRDVAIVGNEGHSVEAELRLADAMGVPIFVLHDFDRTGLTICQNLREGTWRHRYENPVEVIEIGLRLDQVEGLESEPIDENNRKSVGDDRLRECGATEDEIEFLDERRVELNALTTEQLVDLVEAALDERGITKIVPTGEDLAAAWRSAMAHAEIVRAVETANAKAEHWQDEPAPSDLADQIREMLEDDPDLSWDEALRLLCT